MKGENIDGFSIVLCTYNGRKKLAPTLKHLASLLIPACYTVELIIVDNASTDDTASFVKESWINLGTPFPLLLVSESRPGKGYAIEVGYDAAQYSYILTVDDDNWLNDDYLVNAVELFEAHPDVGILQGRSIGEFETELPTWAEGLESFFVIGSPIENNGYFPENTYQVWGAGMILLNKDWKKLRKLGFSFLTSKNGGKAAGEDHETAIAILLLGKKIYYSDTLLYRHFMPADRIEWQSMKSGFNIWSYLTYYYLVYALVLESFQSRTTVTKGRILTETLKRTFYAASKYTWKQHVAYWLMPKDDVYQLGIYREYSYYGWMVKLSKNISHDVKHLRKWMIPLLEDNPDIFKMSVHSTYKF